MEENELTEDERETLDWINTWEVNPVLCEDDGTMDMVVVVSRPPWRDEDAEDDDGEPDEVRITYGTELPAMLWEAMPKLVQEQAKQAMRGKAWGDICDHSESDES